MAALLAAIPAAAEPPAAPIDISTRPITEFQIGRDTRDFGGLRFVGGLEMTGSSRHFGALSGFRFLTPGRDFIGVADTGFWYFGRVERDESGRPVGISHFAMQPIVNGGGEHSALKWDVDAESIAVRDGIATVGFERDHRIAQYRIDREGMAGPVRMLDFLIPRSELRSNRGFETIAYAPDGTLVAITEKSLDREGNIFAAVLSGAARGVFTIRRIGSFDVSDGAFLPDGDLLLLERSFSMAAGVKMRIRRIPASKIGPGNLADGPILLEADMAYQIDNMEGLDVWRGEDGSVRLSLVSDDNHSLLQRNLYLEFMLMPD